MHVVIVPDSFKENLTAIEVADAIGDGVLDVAPQAQVSKFPFSDGGEGSLDVLCRHAQGKLISCATSNALGESIEAQYFLFEDGHTAWIELSQAAGLAQILPNKRNILKATTYGTGLQIRDAINKGCTHIILGVGGSATNDGGAGIFQALGGKLLDQQGNPLAYGGQHLKNLDRIVPPESMEHMQWTIACDVENPLLGPYGATQTYGPQKGASPDMIEDLEFGLTHFSNLIFQRYNRDIRSLKGGGAAGGTAAGMYGFFNATVKSGFSLLAQMTALERILSQADLIYTGEGKIDAQSLHGKLTVAVARLGKKHKIPVIGLGGTIEGPYDTLYQEGFSGIFSIQKGPISLEESKTNASQLLRDASSRITQLYALAKP